MKDELSKFLIFRDLTDQELTKIVQISIFRTWKKGSHIFMQGEPMENVYFAINGKVKIYKSDMNGKEQIVAILKKGDMFPHVGFFRKGNYPAYSEVLEHAAIIAIPIHSFEKIILDNTELCIKIFHVLAEKIIDLQERLEEQILNKTNEQIIKLLIRLAKSHGMEQSNGFFLLKGEFTNQDLASMIGTTRETVNRTLTKLRSETLIEVNTDGTMLFQPEKLLEKLLS